MKTLRRIALLGLFALVGIALAIGVGLCAKPPTEPLGRAPDQQPAAQGATAERRAVEADTSAKMDRRDPTNASSEAMPGARPGWPASDVPGGFTLVAPLPTYAQQVVPQIGQDRLRQIYNLVQQQLTNQIGRASCRE